jgi:hypothetical protein
MRIQILCLLLFFGSVGNLFAQADTLVTIGGTTDFSSIEPDGTLEFHGNATVWEDYVVPFTSVKIRAETSPPDFQQFQDNGASSTGVYGYAFDASTLQEVFFTIQMPHSWAGTAIHPHIHWSPAVAGNGTENVVWGLEYTWINYNPTTSLAFPLSTTVTATSDAISGQALHHLITEFNPIAPIVDDQDGISSILVVRFFRDPDNSADNYAHDAFALSFDIHYERNTVGSRQEFIK